MAKKWKRLEKSRIKEFLNELHASYEIWLPYLEEDKWRFKEYDIEKEIDLPSSFVHDSIKRLFLPRRKRIMEFNKHKKWPVVPVSPPAANRLLMGIHACDGAALQYLDRVFIDSPYKDTFYEAERNRTVIAGIQCDRMESMCHCTDRGISPEHRDGMDIIMSRTKNGYLLQAITEKGHTILNNRILAETDEQPVKKEWSDQRYPLATPEAFLESYSVDIWRDVMKYCLTCGICTFGCPTCTCFHVADELYKNEGERVAVWDSCQFRSYSRMAAGHNPRARTFERIKNRIMDKFAYSFLRYGQISCTGCGRCVVSCPVKCSLPETATLISNTIKQKKPSLASSDAVSRSKPEQ